MVRALTRYAIAWLGVLFLPSGNYQVNQARQQMNQMTAEDSLSRLGSALGGTVNASGEDASGKYYVLQIRPQGGRGATYYVDKSTFLPIKMEMPKKEGIVTTYFEDWREVSGIKTPYQYRQTERDTKNNALIKEEEVSVNTAIAANT